MFSSISSVWQQQADLQLDRHPGIGQRAHILAVTPHSAWHPKMPPSHFLSQSRLRKQMQPPTHTIISIRHDLVFDTEAQH